MTNTQNNPAGYSIEEGNAASRNAYGWAKKTFANRRGKPGEPAQNLDGGFSNEIRFGAERLRSAPTATRWPAKPCNACLATTGTRPRLRN